MNHDINVGKVRLNCFRQSKEPGVFMLQMRVPGGTVDAKYLSYVEHISRTWGDGNFHFGTRQTFDIPGIKYENIPINRKNKINYEIIKRNFYLRKFGSLQVLFFQDPEISDQRNL